jgi:16S rRNA (guanine1207-N2)-methyltransferase
VQVQVQPRRQEQLLIDLLPELKATRVLCISAGLAQFARTAAARWPQASVHCHYLDLYHSQQAVVAGAMPGNLAIGCEPDFPMGEFDLVALPFSARGEAELTRDLMQAGHQALGVSGQLIVSTDNPRDQWLHGQMRSLFDTVTRRPVEGGVVYLAAKRRPLRRLKNFTCEFVFHDRGRTILVTSRPGVFSHRRIDPGARQLINAMKVWPGARVLDIGCGSGTVSLAAALRGAEVHVRAVDSSARAVQCTQIGARRNGLTHLTTDLNASGDYEGRGSYDLALANPPYFADFHIAALFLEAGRLALRPGGQILAVTKSPDWYRRHMGQWFDDVRGEPSKEYFVFRGIAPQAP